jgi:hypothetical protein
MSRGAAGAGPEPTVSEFAALAEQGVRELVHRTRPGTSELSGPAEVAEVIAVLAGLTGMLPQLCEQLTDWLEDHQRGGRLRVDDLASAPEAAQTVHATAGGLTHAGQCAQRAARALEDAHQHAAHLAATADSQGVGWSR